MYYHLHNQKKGESGIYGMIQEHTLQIHHLFFKFDQCADNLSPSRDKNSKEVLVVPDKLSSNLHAY